MATEASNAASDSWRLPAEAQPPLVGELVERIDEALATARGAESAAIAIGAAALEEAEEARRLAGLAAQSAAAGGAGRASGAPGGRPRSGAVLVDGSPQAGASDPLEGFNTRADRLAERLGRLQRLPLSA